MGYVKDHAAPGDRRSEKRSVPLSPGQQRCHCRRGERGPRGAHSENRFSGTSRQRCDNFNAPLAVTKAAVLYVFRTLVAEPIPLNAGCMRPLELVIPEGSMLNPKPPATVAAGNVETS